MNEACDRCPARAITYVTRADARLFFCADCATRHFAELMEQFWTFWPIDAQVMAAPLPVDPTRLHWPDLPS